MKRLTIGFVSAATAAWLFGLFVCPPAPNMRSLMHEVYFYNGLLAWGAMAAAIVTVAKPTWLPRLTGLSGWQFLPWHRNFGIAAVVLSLVHWATRYLFSPLVQPFATEPVKKLVRSAAANGGLDAFWGSLRGFANSSAMVITVAVVVLTLIVLIPKFKGQKAMFLHKGLSIAFPILSVHCIRLMDTADFLMPFGWLNIVVTLIGCWYSMKLLVGAVQKTTRSKRVKNTTTA